MEDWDVYRRWVADQRNSVCFEFFAFRADKLDRVIFRMGVLAALRSKVTQGASTAIAELC